MGIKKSIVSFCLSVSLLGTALGSTFAVAHDTEENANLGEIISEDLDLWYDEPTFDDSSPAEGEKVANTNWQTETVPIGNGHMGALIYGGVKEEQLTLNDKTLWEGGPGMEDYNYGNWPENQRDEKAANIKKVQQMINEQISVPTGTVASMLAGDTSLFLKTFGEYQTLADLKVTMGHSGTGYTEYTRGLDLDSAVSTVEYTIDGVTYKREYFFSYPDLVLVARYTASTPGAISMTTQLTGRQTSGFAVTAEHNTIKLRGTLPGNGLLYEAQARVMNEGGSVTVDRENVVVEHADTVTIVYSSNTDYKQEYPTYRGEDPSASVTQRIEKAGEKTYKELLTSHKKDYEALYGRVKLDIGQKRPSITTDQLVDKYPTKTETDNRYYEALTFNYGRYLLIASSRAGSLPANLQGVWNPKLTPPWDSDYHLNINMQMCYWGASSCNLDETMMPYIDFMKAQQVPGHETVKNIYGIEDADAWIIHNPTNAFGHTGLQWYPNGFWYPESSGWLLRDMVERYYFTQDESYLQETLYPMMKGNIIFWLNYLTEDPRDPGALVCNPSLLPEEPPFTAGGSMSQQIVADHFLNFMDICEQSGHMDALYDQVREAYNKLDKGLTVSEENGMIRAWKYMEGDPASKHRHLNQAYALYPANQISFDSTAELMKAEETFVDNRGDAAVGWSRAWKMALWARMQNPERALRVYQGLLADLTGHNLFMQGPPFQIDANLGVPGAVAEMLLQSHQDYIEPLLGLPEAWGNGSVQGLKARGNFVIDMQWSDQSLDKMMVTAQSGGTLRIKHANLDTATVTVNGSIASLIPVEGMENLYEMDTEIGDKIEIVRSFDVTPAPKDLKIIKEKGSESLFASWSPAEKAEKYIVKRIHNGQYTIITETVDTKIWFKDSIPQTQYVVTAVVDHVESMPSLYVMPTEVEKIVEPATEPTAHWSFDAIDGQTVINSVKDNPQLNATAGSNISYASGISGTAAVFPGNNEDYSSSILAPVHIQNINTQSFAVSLWVKTDPSTPNFLVSLLQFDQNVGVGGKGRTVLAVAKDNGMKFATTLNNAKIQELGGENIPEEWQHLVVVSNRMDKTYSFYINGELKGKLDAFTITHDNVAVDLRIGQHRNHLQSFIGMIDEVQYFDSFITLEKVKELYQEVDQATIEDVKNLLAQAEELLDNGTVSTLAPAYLALQTKIEEAKAIIELESPKQEEIKSIVDALNIAIMDYLNAAVDRSTLKLVLDLANAHVAAGDVDKLIPTAQEQFNKALASAQGICDNPDATQEQVDNAWKTLMNVIHALGFVPGDKTELINLVAEAKGIALGDYEDGAEKDAFTAALQAAEDVIADKDAMKLDIDASYKTLEAAMQNLIPKPAAGDKTELKKVIDEAEVKNGQLDKYVDDAAAKKAFAAALQAANDMYLKDGATQDEIDGAKLDLLTAMAGLRLRADKSSLNDWLDELKAIDLTEYTAESAAVVRAVIARAEALAAQDLGEDQLGEIQAMIAEMENAKAQLEKAPAEPEDPENPDDSSKPDDTSKPDDSKPEEGNPSADETSSEGKDATDKAPTTGDRLPIAAFSVLALASAGAWLLSKRKK